MTEYLKVYNPYLLPSSVELRQSTFRLLIELGSHQLSFSTPVLAEEPIETKRF